MKFLIVFAAMLGTSAYAQTPESDLNKAFQREYVYLVSQKEALGRQRTQMERSFAERTGKSKAAAESLQRQVARMAAANDERHEELVTLERQKKELQKRGTSLESTFKKATQTLGDFRRELKFDSSKDKTPVAAPENIALTDLAPVFEEAFTVLKKSSQSETFQGHYLDSKGDLKEGSVTRLGRVAAFVKNQDGEYILGPSGTGSLKVLEAKSAGSVFLFDNLSEAARIQRPPTIVEHLANLGPILFLGLMLLMVAGLFLVLVRI
jgi:biopolymer transport protein ExbB